jgi:multicomponent K+:H+ antiporter subunit D
MVGGMFFLLAVLIAGLPPLSGFLGKWMLLQAALDQPGMPWVYAVVLTAGLLTIVALARSGSLLFYRSTSALQADGSVMVPAARGEADSGGRAVAGPDWPRLAPVLGLVGLCLLLVIAAGPVTDFTAAMAEALLAPERYVEAVLGGPTER